MPPILFGSMKEVSTTLLDAIDQGRPVIPIVGAGISADSGFPVLMSIVRYFGKLRMAIEHRASLPGDPHIHNPANGEEDPLHQRYEAYKRENWRFIKDFGWPDRYQLTEDLFITLEEDAAHKGETAVTVSEAIRTGLEQLLGVNQPVARAEFENLKKRLENGFAWSEELIRTIEGEIGAESKRSHEEWKDLLKDLPKKSPGPRSILEPIKKEFTEAPWGKNAAWQVFGDWRRMILGFTNYRGDFADGLLDRFARHRLPNLAHRYLAFLIRRLNVSVIFTMNFDAFIEEALEEEGLRPRIFAMEHGLTLPHDMLVRDQLAVIKMHGSTHALLLDEQLERPLSSDYLSHFTNIAGSRGADPMLLVIGCSGEDNRLFDLVQQAISLNPLGKPDSLPRVVWIHYEDEPPNRVVTLNAPSIGFYHTNSVGGTLQHLYSEIDSLHPTSRGVYLTHTQSPILLGDFRSQSHALWIDTAWKATKKLLLIETVNQVGNPETEYADPSATWSLTVLGNTAARWGHNLIWVDLEATHSLSAVAGTIIDQCRKYDPALAPCVLSIDDETEKVVQVAAERVSRALRRSRSFVAFSGIEAYIWSPTSHHGDTHSAARKAKTKRLTNLVTFLIRLAAAKLGESRLAVSIDPPRTRTERDLLGEKLVKRVLKKLQKVSHPAGPLVRCVKYADDFVEAPAGGLKSWEVYRSDHCPSSRPVPLLITENGGKFVVPAELKTRWAMAFGVMATFRRTRPLPLVRRVLRIILGGHADAFLELNLHTGTFRQIEGGSVIFFRELRDNVYGFNTSGTSARMMKEIIVDKQSANVARAVFQLLFNACAHQLVARAWYSEAFLQSHDTFTLLEYLYHRLASIRALTKLIGLNDLGSTEVREAMCEGLELFGQLIGTVRRDEILEEFELDADFFDPENWNDQLVRRHTEETKRLESAWRRSETLLRVQVPAEQLVRWCEQFIEDDLRFRCHTVVMGYDKKSGEANHFGVVSSLLKSTEGENNQPCRDKPPIQLVTDVKILDKKYPPNRALLRLRAYVTSFYRKILIERSDYQRCLDLGKAEQSPKASVTDVSFLWNDAIELPEQTAMLEAILERAHHAIDSTSCRLRRAQQETGSISKLAEQIASHNLIADLKMFKDRNLSYSLSPSDGGRHEIWLRGLHVLSDCYFLRLSVFTHEGFDGTPKSKALEEFNRDSYDAIAELHKVINKGSKLARVQTGTNWRSLHSPVVNAVEDGTLYLQYRSIFAVQASRLEWLQAIHEHSADPECVAKAVDAALRGFENARAGLRESNNLLLALADLHAAEACLAHGRLILHPDAPPFSRRSASEVDRFGLNRSRHEAARGFLNRASEALMNSQRNIVWLRFYFRLAAQYQSDRLLMGLVNASRSRPRDLGLHIQRIRRGYESVRNAEDLYLNRDNGSQPSDGGNPKSWLHRLRWELTLCGFALGLITWSRFICYKDKITPVEFFGTRRRRNQRRTNIFEKRRDYLLKQLNRLIATAGLQWDGKDDLDLRTEYCERIFNLVSEAEIERAVGQNPEQLRSFDDAGDHARELRQEVIDLAAKISRGELSR